MSSAADSRFRRWCVVAAALVSTHPACAATDAPSADAEVTLTPPRLLLDLPAGVEVFVDGSPIVGGAQPVELTSGAHHVKLATSCGSVERIDLDVRAGETLTLDEAAVPELQFGTLVVKATTLDLAPLDVTLSIDSENETPMVFGQSLRVAACAWRLRVAAPELGGFVEDIQVGHDEVVTRDIVLVPGPDVVRIHGGEFVLGAPKRVSDAWREADFMDVLDPGLMAQRKVVVETFDIDRTEVTVEQLLACRKTGGSLACHTDEECAKRRACFTDGRTRSATRIETKRKSCNVEAWYKGGAIKPGHNNRPANCVARWEAEQYCAWVGKRLPTATEFEYAARSGNSDYEYPWGNEMPDCSRSDEEQTRLRVPLCPRSQESYERASTLPVCAWPRGATQQGVCDMMSNVQEYVTIDAHGPMLWMTEHYVEPRARWSENAGVGFRCARSVDLSRFSARSAMRPQGNTPVSDVER